MEKKLEFKRKAIKSICCILCSMIMLGMCTAFAEGVKVVSWQHLSSVTGDIPAPANNSGQARHCWFDIDKNGINDFVIASWNSTEPVAWYRRGPSDWTKYIIDPHTQYLEAGGTFYDIDGDGDLDIVFGDVSGGSIYWWENPYPNFAQTHRGPPLIKSSGANNHHDMMFGDFDGDGQIEFVSWNATTNLVVPASPERAASGRRFVRPVNPKGSRRRYHRHCNREYVIGCDGSGSNMAHLIDDGYGLSRSVGYHRQRVSRWFFRRCRSAEMVSERHWQSHILVSNVIHGHSLALADINGDGNLDVFIGEMAKWGSSAPENPNAKVRVLYGEAAATSPSRL